MKKLLLGLLAGASLGMLFSPKKGKDLRKELSKSEQKFSDFGKIAVEAAKDASAEVQNFLKDEKVQELLAKGKETLELVLSEGTELSRKGQSELKKVLNKVQGKETSDVVENVKNFLNKKL